MKSSTAFFMSTLKASTCCFERDTNRVVDKKNDVPSKLFVCFLKNHPNVKKLVLFG